MPEIEKSECQPGALSLSQQFKLKVIKEELDKATDLKALRQMCFSLWQQQMIKANLTAHVLKTDADEIATSMMNLRESLQKRDLYIDYLLGQLPESANIQDYDDFLKEQR